MRFYKYIYIALTLLAFVSCTEDIDINLDSSGPELVVDGVVNTDTTTHTIYLKKSLEIVPSRRLNLYPHC